MLAVPAYAKRGSRRNRKTEHVIPEIIHKKPRDGQLPPNLRDYGQAYAEFSWDQAARELR